MYFGADRTSYTWDFEGTDTNFSNNWYPGGGPNINDNGRSYWGRGGSCWAVFGNNFGGPGNHTVELWFPPNSAYYVNGPAIMSSLFWSC